MMRLRCVADVDDDEYIAARVVDVAADVDVADVIAALDGGGDAGEADVDGYYYCGYG